jgi:chromosomal replication initiation ATPase DnaA
MAQQRIKCKTGIGVSIMLRSSQDPLNTPEKMLQKIALSLNMSFECFTKRSREREIAELRFLGAHFLRVHFPAITLQQIAALFGGLDHSTVISGLVRANNLIYTADTRFMVKYQTVLNAVNQ